MRSGFGTVSKVVLCSLLATVVAAGCRSTESEEGEGEEGKETRVTLEQLSAPARATVERLTAGGKIEKIDHEVEDGVSLYDVEANVGGKHVEYAIAEADGAVIGTETSIEFAELPAAVREAAAKFFDSTDGLKAMKGVEKDVTSYEVEGKRKGKVVEATFDPTGKKIE